MTLEDVIKFVQGVGFPIAVAVYLLVFMNTTLQKMIQILSELRVLIESRLPHNGGS